MSVFQLSSCFHPPTCSIDVLATFNRTLLPYPSTPIKFQTFPDPRLPTGTHFRFVSSSCITHNFPYIPLQGRRIWGFETLSRYLFAPATHDNNTVPTQFMLFLGDFIYADVPVYIGDKLEAYRQRYRRAYASKSFRAVYERLGKDLWSSVEHYSKHQRFSTCMMTTRF